MLKSKGILLTIRLNADKDRFKREIEDKPLECKFFLILVLQLTIFLILVRSDFAVHFFAEKIIDVNVTRSNQLGYIFSEARRSRQAHFESIE